MLSLEQIQRLEEKVFKAVELIKALKEENSILKSEVKSANKKIEELEQIISDYRTNQVEIEEGIVKAIKQLDDLDQISTVNSALSGSNNSLNVEKNSSLKDSNSASSDDIEILSDETEEPKINYSKISQNSTRTSNITEKKSPQTSVQSEADKNDNSQLDIF